MSSADVLTATPATAVPTAGAAAGGGDGAPAGEAASGGGFTALLAAALGTSDATAVAQVLQGLQQAGDGETAAPDVPLEGDGDPVDASSVALQQAVADLVAEVGPLRLPTEARGEASPGTGTPVEGEVDGARTAATAESRATRAALLSALRAAATAGRAPTAGQEGQATADGTATLRGTAAASTTRPQAPAEASGGTPVPTEAASRSAAGPSAARVVVSPAADTGATSGSTADGAPPAPAPVTPAVTGTATTGAPAAAPAAAPSAAPPTAPAAPPAPADGGLHARVVSRVIEAAELLENAPPPRRMTVEVPDSDGLRLQVAMRGAEVHVSLHAGRGAPDLGAWGRELAASLASRGMSLGGFDSGDASQADRDQQQGHEGQPRPTGQDDQPGRHDGRRRPPRDGDLRL